MRQQVVVTTDAPIPLKPLLASAIQSELRVLELGVARIAERLQAFEKQYGLMSAEFAHGFATGEIGESLDYADAVVLGCAELDQPAKPCDPCRG
jgi:hypothetical protein